MKIDTSAMPMSEARMPLWMASLPSEASIMRFSRILTGAGSEPALRMLRSSAASSMVKLPLIEARPLGIGSRMTGAE